MALNTEQAQVQISASVSGAQQVEGLAKDINGVTQSQAELTKQQQSFLGSLDKMTQTFGKTRSEVLQWKADMLGVGSAASPVIGELQKMGIDGEHSFGQLIKSGGAFRELLVLMHESLIMGNWSRFGGSLMVMAERMNLSAAIFSLLGASTLGATAAMAGLVAAVVEGEQESSRFARAMTLTGSMAGVTEGQFNQMAESIGEQIPGSVLKARTALEGLVQSGQFTGDTLASMGRAAVLFSQYSGQTADEVVKDFAGMKDGVAKWAEKANEQYHFLTAAQYEYIQTLEKQGQVEAAEKAVADDMYNHMRQTGTENLGILEKAIRGVSNALHGLWDGLEGLGRASTLEDQLASLEAIKAHPNRSNWADVKNGTIDAQIAAIQKQIADQQAAVAAAAHQDQVQQLGISAHDDLQGFLPPPDKVQEKVQELKTKIAEALAANPSDPVALNLQAHMQEAIARIQKEYGQAGSHGLNKPDANGYVIGSDDTGKLSTQLQLMQEYARATKQSETAVLDLELAQGKLEGFTAAQIQELRDRARRDDALANAQASAALEGRYQNELARLTGQNGNLSLELQQLQQLGVTAAKTETQIVKLAIAQGDLKGIPQSEIDTILKLAQANDQLQAAVDAQKNSGMSGTEQAFHDYVAQAEDSAQHVKKVWMDTFKGMEDALVTTLEGGKFDFRQFALSIVDDLLRMEVEQHIMGPLVNLLGGLGGGTNGSGIAKIIGSLAGGHFASGGIMTSGGPLPLNKYANGGVANSPQLALFGEGRGPEAYVPLPDGRSIPVSVKGGAGGVTNHVTNNIVIQSDGSSQVTADDAKRMNAGLTYAIQQELIKQHRDGGIFSSSGMLS